ncbi:MAG: Stf0 family sulfotransferase [Thermomicrobiales bacterium]
MTDDQSSTSSSQTWDQYGSDYDQPRFEGHPRTYMIASMPRSGSHMLGHLLFSTGELGSPLEYVHPQHFAKWQKQLGENDPASTLRGIMARRTTPNGRFGFKAHWPQFSRSLEEDVELLEILDIQDWLRITRTDKVSQAISLVIARQTKSWISFHEEKQEPTYDFEAIATAVRGLKKQEAAWDAFFTGRNITPHVVVYEAMLADPGQTVADVCTSLDVPVPAVLPEPGTAQQATARNIEWRERYIEESRNR